MNLLKTLKKVQEIPIFILIPAAPMCILLGAICLSNIYSAMKWYQPSHSNECREAKRVYWETRNYIFLDWTIISADRIWKYCGSRPNYVGHYYYKYYYKNTSRFKTYNDWNWSINLLLSTASNSLTSFSLLSPRMTTASLKARNYLLKLWSCLSGFTWKTCP